MIITLLTSIAVFLLKGLASVYFLTWTTPRTWVPGELVTAGMMNTHVRDNMNSIRSEHFTVQRFRGMVLRTHPDQDVAVSKVMLVHADEITADDATRFTAVDRLVADITVAGAGGLDTGAEAASTWYEIWFIAKDDGTKNLLLHKSFNYSKDTSFETADNNGRLLRLATGTATDRLAQGIQFANAGPLSHVDLKMNRNGAVAGRVWLSIQADSAGNPSGTPLATSDKLDISALTTSVGDVRFVFRNPFSVSAATQYHLVMEGDYTRSDTVNVGWRGVTAGGYANGASKEYNGTTWAAASGPADFNFKAWITANSSSPTMPSGYTKKALLGFVYNNASSNFNWFEAHDNEVRWIYNIVGPDFTGAFTSAVPTLIDMSAYIPPRPVRLTIVGLHTVAGSSISVAGVPHFGLLTNIGDYGISWLNGPVASYIADMADVFTSYQAVFVATSAATAHVYLQGYRWS